MNRFDQLLDQRALEPYRKCTNPKCNAGHIVANSCNNPHTGFTRNLLTAYQTKNNSSVFVHAGLALASALDRLDTKPASKQEGQGTKGSRSRRLLRVAGLKPIPRRAMRVDDTVKRLVDAIISSVQRVMVVVELNGVGFVGPNTMISDGMATVRIGRFASIMVEGWDMEKGCPRFWQWKGGFEPAVRVALDRPINRKGIFSDEFGISINLLIAFLSAPITVGEETVNPLPGRLFRMLLADQSTSTVRLEVGFYHIK